MTFSGKIMGGEKLDAVSLTFYTSPVVLGLLLPVAAGVEWEKMTRAFDGGTATTTRGSSAAEEETTGRRGSSPDPASWRLVLIGCVNAVVYNWVHNKVIAMTSATTTTVLGNVKVAMLFLFSRVLFGETRDWTWEMALGAGVALGVRAVFVREAARARKASQNSQGT